MRIPDWGGAVAAHRDGLFVFGGVVVFRGLVVFGGLVGAWARRGERYLERLRVDHAQERQGGLPMLLGPDKIMWVLRPIGRRAGLRRPPGPAPACSSAVACSRASPWSASTPVTGKNGCLHDHLANVFDFCVVGTTQTTNISIPARRLAENEGAGLAGGRWNVGGS